jgi:hypothetical protein
MCDAVNKCLFDYIPSGSIPNLRTNVELWTNQFMNDAEICATNMSIVSRTIASSPKLVPHFLYFSYYFILVCQQGWDNVRSSCVPFITKCRRYAIMPSTTTSIIFVANTCQFITITFDIWIFHVSMFVWLFLLSFQFPISCTIGHTKSCCK